jgi:EmrB/QacA subfamily drug resistance transporter
MEIYDSATKKAILFVTCLSSFLTAFMGSSVNIAIKVIGEEYMMDAITLSWVATSYLLSTAVFLVPFGKIADIYGRKKIFILGLIIYSLFSFLTIFAPNSMVLIILRVFQGVGGAMLFGTTMAIITSVYSSGERGKALGIYISSVYVGLSLGPVLGGILTHNFGWKSIFLINFPLGILCIILVFMKMKQEWTEAKHDKFDIFGSIIYGIGLLAIMYGLSRIPHNEGFWILIIGIIIFIAFIIWEMRVKHPILNINLFRNNRTFTFSSLAALINYSATFAVTFLMSLYLQYIKQMTPQQAGFILVFQPVTMAAFASFAGRLSDRHESRIIATIGMTFTVIGIIMLALLSESTPIFYIVFCMIFLGLGFGFFSSPNSNAIMSAVESKNFGIASAIVSTMRLCGQMLSMGIATLVISIFIGTVQITHEYHSQLMQSIKIVFAICAVLCFAGIFASMARGKR